MCTPAIKSVLTQYEVVLAALEEMASDKGSVSAPRARGLHGHFHKGTTVLGLVMGQDILLKLEGLNKTFQGRAVSIRLCGEENKRFIYGSLLKSGRTRLIV